MSNPPEHPAHPSPAPARNGHVRRTHLHPWLKTCFQFTTDGGRRHGRSNEKARLAPPHSRRSTVGRQSGRSLVRSTSSLVLAARECCNAANAAMSAIPAATRTAAPRPGISYVDRRAGSRKRKSSMAPTRTLLLSRTSDATHAGSCCRNGTMAGTWSRLALVTDETPRRVPDRHSAAARIGALALLLSHACAKRDGDALGSCDCGFCSCAGAAECTARVGRYQPYEQAASQRIARGP